MRYWFQKHRLAEVDATKLKYGQRHRVIRSREGQEDGDSECGTGVVPVGLRTGEQADSKFIVLGSRDGEEGGDQKISG